MHNSPVTSDLCVTYLLAACYLLSVCEPLTMIVNKAVIHFISDLYLLHNEIAA
jgi:hypothetical protein